MKAAGITLSTVGAGGGSNPFLAELASQGGGRFYPAANPASIPDIFLKETQQVSGQQIVEEDVPPDHHLVARRSCAASTRASRSSSATTARRPRRPRRRCSSRPATIPLLAQWQYGLGRAVAWTSDSTGRWAKAWVGWDGFSKFFSQLVGWTFPGEETGGIEASFVTEGSTTRLRVESVAEDGSPRDFYATAVAITDPELDAARGRPGPGRAGRLRGAARRDRRRCLRRPGVADAARRDAARTDARARRADAGRVPAARHERRVPRDAPVRDGRAGDRAAGRAVGPRPRDDRRLHGPLAVAAGPGAAAVAARHRAPTGLGRAARAGRCAAVGRRWLARCPDGAAAGRGLGDAGRSRPGRGLVRAGGDPARRRRTGRGFGGRRPLGRGPEPGSRAGVRLARAGAHVPTGDASADVDAACPARRAAPPPPAAAPPPSRRPRPSPQAPLPPNRATRSPDSARPSAGPEARSRPSRARC